MTPQRSLRCLVIAALAAVSLPALRAQVQVPENLVAEPVPAITKELRADLARYMEFRAAGFSGWHPVRHEMLIATRFADTPQLHAVAMPGGARRQLTFGAEPVGGGGYEPVAGEYILFAQDTGGSEFYQYHRLDLKDGRITLLTDGKSRNTGAKWSEAGDRIAYTSTRRNGKSTDIHVMSPLHPEGDACVLEVEGGGWGVLDWSPDDKHLLLGQYISINESRIHELDLTTGKVRLLAGRDGDKVAYSGAEYTRDGKAVLAVSDRGAEFGRLVRLSIQDGSEAALPVSTRWEVEDFAQTQDGSTLAYVTNEDGASVLHLRSLADGKELPVPTLPLGTISGLRWHKDGKVLGFSLSSARSPSDVWSYEPATGGLTRWTESETGGMSTANFREPELLRVKSFDGLEVSGFLYRPDPAKFPGPRPIVINIHGGPEGQSRPGFIARNNYYLNELGVAVLFPNVRGSVGYGKTFMTLDNGFKREDSVKDIGAFLDTLAKDPAIAADRIAVMGGSYGGYMTLASLMTYGNRLRCGVDVVGISNFVTFLKNTQDYRRDLRRVEYGDERDPAMAKFLETISPANHAEKFVSPLFVVQGKNDPRVPVTEAEQMVKAIRDRGGKVWYLMAKDEGHGFQKKRNADYQFMATILFFQENLLK